MAIKLHAAEVVGLGGKIIDVEISAKQNIGIDNLLEMILLTAEVENFRANPSGKTIGTIIESKISQGKGATATVIVQNGTLKVGDIIATFNGQNLSWQSHGLQ